MTDDRQVLAELREQFRHWIQEGGSADRALDSLLFATRSRATGLWCRDGDHLLLLGFRSVDDMAPEVSEEFVASTTRTPLTASGLAIVEAVSSRRPAQGRLRAHGLAGSAGWLERFGAVESLAVPVDHDKRVVGVLAISSGEPIPSDGRVWTLMLELASAIAPSLS